MGSCRGSDRLLRGSIRELDCWSVSGFGDGQVRGASRMVVFVVSLFGERVHVLVPVGYFDPSIRYRGSDSYVDMEFGKLPPYNRMPKQRLWSKRSDEFFFWSYRGCSVANPFM